MDGVKRKEPRGKFGKVKSESEDCFGKQMKFPHQLRNSGKKTLQKLRQKPY